MSILAGLWAHHTMHALKTAIELDVFSAIAEGRSSAAEVAAATAASEKGIRVLCDYLCVRGYLTKSDGRYFNTPESALFLVKSSPAYMGGITEFLLSPLFKAAMDDLTETVRRGGRLEHPVTEHAEEEVWERFARCMRPVVGRSAAAVAEVLGSGDAPLKVLDVASSHGLFGISVAERHPNAVIYANDWPEVVVYSKAAAERAGMGERYHTVPGSAFEVDFGSDFDVILVPNFLHHFGFSACVSFLAKCRGSLGPAGRVVVVEFVVEEDRISPPMANTFAMQMLASTPEGDCYTEAELRRMYSEAGFGSVEVHAEPGSPARVFVGRE
jgi:2-polyprenyl-3-methyl-5-hydroxy-6-metoxy-1,4-benzoquinol methylase